MQPATIAPVEYENIIAVQPINLAVISKHLAEFKAIEDKLNLNNINILYRSRDILEGSNALPLEDINVLAVDLFWPLDGKYLIQTLWAVKLWRNIKVVAITRSRETHPGFRKELESLNISGCTHCHPVNAAYIISCIDNVAKGLTFF